MAHRLSRRMRLIFAILLAVVLYIQQLYMTASQFGGNILALNMPTILGTGVPSVFVAFMSYWFLGIQRKPPNFSFQRFFAKRKQSSKEDDWAYIQATSEIDASSQDKGIWGRAIAESNGNDGIAKAKYIKLRADRLLSETKLV